LRARAACSALRHASATEWTEAQYFSEKVFKTTVPAFQSIWTYTFWVSDDVQDEIEIAAWLPGNVQGPWEMFSYPAEEAALYGFVNDADAVLFKLLEMHSINPSAPSIRTVSEPSRLSR
jgi:hypothetical protein